MEAGDIGSRQSGTTTADSAPDRYEQRHHYQHYPRHQRQHSREILDRSYREAPSPAMATATLISPSTPYPGHPHSFTPGYPHVTTGPPGGGMISPVEPRRLSDDADAPPQQRQSLPSISEVISSTRSEYPQPGPGPPTSLPPAGAPGPAPASAASSFPSPFSATARPYPEPPIEKGPSPRPMQPSSSYPPGQQPLPAFADSPRARQFGGGRPGPPPIVGPYSAPHPSPPIKQDPLRPESDKPPEHHINGAYPHSHPPPPPMSYPPPGHGQLPPGQLPLSAGYPVSPRHPGPPLPSPYDSQRTPRPEDEAQHARRYDMAVHRSLESWSYTDCLNRVATGARTIFNFAEGYHKIVGEHATPRMIPERLPNEREMGEMLNNVDFIKRLLEQLRDQVQQNLRHEQMQGKMKGPYEDEDVQMYDTAKPALGVAEVKKRRGRAAPPGRCHSCNRIDTPEWRRGPDGARTLCNACGLHYAKLERKRLLEARSIRPKGSDEQN